MELNILFKNSDNGLQKMNFRVESGNLIGIMGGSGVGKTTLAKPASWKDTGHPPGTFI